MVMTRRRILWFVLLVGLFIGGLMLAAFAPVAAVDLLMAAVIGLAALLLVLQRAARHTAGWKEPGPFYAGSDSGPRGPRTPHP